MNAKAKDHKLLHNKLAYCLSIAGNGAQVTVFDLINQMCTGQPDVEEDGPSQRATESPPAEEPPTPPETRAATGPPPAQPPSPAETRPPITPPPTMQTPSVVRTAPMRGMKTIV